MSLDAIRWALDQAVEKSSAKFVLVVMADCVNSVDCEMLCWPSYKFLAGRTHQDVKTVEMAVYRLKEKGFIVDTGLRRGDTGKIVVYRLNAPKSGCVTPRPQEPEQPLEAQLNAPEIGCIGEASNPPKFPANPPKNGEQSPQIPPAIPPKTGVRSRKNRERTGKEPGSVLTAIDGVPDKTFADWMVARKQVPVTSSVIAGLEREATKAGLTVAEAVIFCAESSWRGFNAGWYADRIKAATRPQSPRSGPSHKFGAAARTIFGNPQSEVIDVETH